MTEFFLDNHVYIIGSLVVSFWIFQVIDYHFLSHQTTDDASILTKKYVKLLQQRNK